MGGKLKIAGNILAAQKLQHLWTEANGKIDPNTSNVAEHKTGKANAAKSAPPPPRPSSSSSSSQLAAHSDPDVEVKC